MRDYFWWPKEDVPAPEAPRVERFFMLDQGGAIKMKIDKPDAIVHYWDGPRVCRVLVE